MEIQGTFNLTVDDPIWSQSQTRRITLDCNTASQPTVINLPEIQEIYDANAPFIEIFINDFANNASANNITLNAGGSDVIDLDGQTSATIDQNGGSIILQVGTSGKWFAIESESQGGGSTEQFIQVDIPTNPLPIGGLDLTVPVEILPAPNPNEYYDITKLILEFEYGGQTTLDSLNGVFIGLDTAGQSPFNGYRYYTGAKDLVGRAYSGLVIVEKSRFENTIDGTPRDYDVADDISNYAGAFEISANNTINDIVGTLKVKCWYELRTFG